MIIPTTLEEALRFSYLEARVALRCEESRSTACVTLVDNGDALQLHFDSDHVVTYFDDGAVTVGLHGHGELQVRPSDDRSIKEGESK